MSIESKMLSNHLIYFLYLLWASVFPSIRVFSNDSALCIRWPKYCSFSISPSEEYSDLVSFRIVWFDLLAVQWRDLCNSMKLWVMPCRAIQFGWVIVKSSDKIWFIGRRMANHYSILTARTPSTVCVCVCVCVSPLFRYFSHIGHYRISNRVT